MYIELSNKSYFIYSSKQSFIIEISNLIATKNDVQMWWEKIQGLKTKSWNSVN